MEFDESITNNTTHLYFDENSLIYLFFYREIIRVKERETSVCQDILYVLDDEKSVVTVNNNTQPYIGHEVVKLVEKNKKFSFMNFILLPNIIYEFLFVNFVCDIFYSECKKNLINY